MRKTNKGFTLVELIIVIAILAIIMLIAIPNFSGIQQRMQVRADKATAAQIGKAVRVWFTDCTTDPSLVSGDDATTLKPDELAVISVTAADTYSIAATSEYSTLCGIEGYMSKDQHPSSMKTDNVTDTNQRYVVFLTAAATNVAAKIVVMVTTTTDGTATAAITSLKGVKATAANTATYTAAYDGIGAGIAYIEP